jgi:hypothetical protein
MFLPSYSSLGVPPTEEDAHRCACFTSKDNKRMSFYSRGAPFDECIQLYYENFRIEISSSSVTIVFFFSFVSFLRGLMVSVVSYNEVWVMKCAFFSRVMYCLVGFFTFYKIFYARVHPENACCKKFKEYVKSVVRLSNFLIIFNSVLNGVVYAWISSLGSCLDASENETDVDNNPFFTMDCNPSYEKGSTPYDAMLLLLMGNMFVIGLLRCHSHSAAVISYFVTVVCAIAGAAVSPKPITSTPALFCVFFSYFVINGMENNNLMMFTTLLQLESTNRIKTTELKQFVGNVAHDLKVSIEKIITLSPLSIIIRNI